MSEKPYAGQPPQQTAHLIIQPLTRSPVAAVTPSGRMRVKEDKGVKPGRTRAFLSSDYVPVHRAHGLLIKGLFSAVREASGPA